MKSLKHFLLLIAIFCGVSSQAQSILAQAEFEAKNAKEVRIKGKFCDVVIEKGSKTFFKGTIEGKGDPDDYEITSEMQGSTLVIQVNKSDRTWTNITRSELKLTIADDIPVMVRNSSGDVYVNGIGGDDHSFETSSGDIVIRNLDANLMVGASSGDVEIDGVTGDLMVETSSGDIELDEVEGTIECRATSGDIDVRNFMGDLTVQATSGDIELSNGEGMIRLKTTSGEIDGRSITLKGNAELRANSGDISISFANNMDDLSFDLESSSGDLRVGGRSSDDKLYMRQGDIWIRGVTTSGSQSYN